MPMSLSCGWSSSRALAWPARPMVASTRMAPAPLSAGARIPRTRSAMTGTCAAAAVPIEPPLPRSVCIVLAWCPARSPSAPCGGRPVPPGAGEEASDETAGRCGWRPRRALGAAVAAALRSSENSWQHLLRCVGERVLLFGQIGLPGGRVPDLQPGIRADHHAVALQGRVVAQRTGDRDPALLVRNLVRGAGEEDPAVVANRLGGDRRRAQRLGDPGELGLRKDVQAPFLSLGQHKALRQLVAVLRREEQAALLVQARRMGAEKHLASPPCPTAPRSGAHSPPTAHHCTPLSSTVNHKTAVISPLRQQSPRSAWWSEVGFQPSPGRPARRARPQAARSRPPPVDACYAVMSNP